MGGGSSKNILRPKEPAGAAAAKASGQQAAAPANRHSSEVVARGAAGDARGSSRPAQLVAQPDNKPNPLPSPAINNSIRASNPAPSPANAVGSTSALSTAVLSSDMRMRRRSSWLLAAEPKSRSCIRAQLLMHLGAPRAVDLVLSYLLVPRVIVCGGLRNRKDLEALTHVEYLTWPPVGSIPAPPDGKEPVFSNSSAGSSGVGLGEEAQSDGRLMTRTVSHHLQWHSLPPLPLPLYDSCCVVIENCLYVIGGCSRQQTGSSPRATRSLFCFDTETQAWTRLKGMEVARSGFAAAVYNGRIYVFGGQPVESAAQSAEVYDPATDTWTLLPHALPDALYFHSAFTHGDNIILMRRGSPHCYVFSPSAGKCVRTATEWLSPPPLNVGATAVIRVPLPLTPGSPGYESPASSAALLAQQYGAADVYALDMEGNCALTTSGMVLRLPPPGHERDALAYLQREKAEKAAVPPQRASGQQQPQQQQQQQQSQPQQQQQSASASTNAPAPASASASSAQPSSNSTGASAGSGPSSERKQAASSTSASMYSGMLRWERLPPFACPGRNAGAVAVVGQGVVVIGGWGREGDQALQSCEVWEPGYYNGQWRRLPDLYLERAQAVAATVFAHW